MSGTNERWLRGAGYGAGVAPSTVAAGPSRRHVLDDAAKNQRSLKASGRWPRTWRQPPKM